MDQQYIYLFKNKAPTGKTLHEKAPTHRLVKRDGQSGWTDLAACWPTKTGTGLSCKLEEGVSFSVQDMAKVDEDFDDFGGTAKSTGDDVV